SFFVAWKHPGSSLNICSEGENFDDPLCTQTEHEFSQQTTRPASGCPAVHSWDGDTSLGPLPHLSSFALQPAYRILGITGASGTGFAPQGRTFFRQKTCFTWILDSKQTDWTFWKQE
uniref:Uncharacterized protein n=1 Tax=Kryptolebias marmoratus TaxID=37003 RepID=A0A3Q3BQW3_KRYMA